MESGERSERRAEALRDKFLLFFSEWVRKDKFPLVSPDCIEAGKFRFEVFIGEARKDKSTLASTAGGGTPLSFSPGREVRKDKLLLPFTERAAGGKHVTLLKSPGGARKDKSMLESSEGAKS